MKKQLTAALLTALLLTALPPFVLTGCETQNETQSEAPTVTADPADALFRADGSTDFVIVRSDTGKGAAVDAAVSLRKRFQETLGFDMKLKTDFIGKPGTDFVESEYEILVGETNRDASRMFDGDALRSRDWAVGREGNKIIVAGTDALPGALDYLFSSCCLDGNLYLPDGFRYVSRGTYALDRFTVAGCDVSELTIVHDGTADASAASKAFADWVLEALGLRLTVTSRSETGEKSLRFVSCASELYGRNIVSVGQDGLTVTCGASGSVREAFNLLLTHLEAQTERTIALEDGFSLAGEAKEPLPCAAAAEAVGGNAYGHKTGDTVTFALSLTNGGENVPGGNFLWTLTTGSGKTQTGTGTEVSYRFDAPGCVWLTASLCGADGKPVDGVEPVLIGAGADVDRIPANASAAKRTDIERVPLRETDSAAREALLTQKKTDVTGSSSDPTTHIYQLENGLMVRYADMKAKKSGEPITILQLTDLHLNRLNDRDREEADPSVSSSHEKRTWCRDGASLPNAEREMGLAPLFHQTVVTGDNLDYLTWGTLELVKETVWGTDPDALMTLGGHDTTRVMQGEVSDPTDYASRLAILQNEWKHDVLYTSRILDDRMMIIALDNANGGYSAEQAAKLSRDLQTCRDENLIALIFEHEPISTGDPADADNTPVRINDTSSSNDFYSVYRGSAKKPDRSGVYALITSSADVVKGIFCGHHHCDHYTEVNATAFEDGKVIETVIPQYVLTGSPYEKGHVLFITVE